MTLRTLGFVIGFFIVSLSQSFATPKHVIIIRHADRVLPNGVCLSLLGLQRAASLAYYFTDSARFKDMPIGHVFAAYSPEPTPYVRCRQTCFPTANKLALPMNTSFNQDQVKEVTQEILTNPKYNGETVLMCWEHHHISLLVKMLGGDDPGSWGEDIFDQVYILTFDVGKKPKIEKVLQKLMYGDRTNFDEKPSSLPQESVPCPAFND